MKDEIIKELRKIEKKEHIRIILAVESGSRAWGFSGTDSDYDVRFIYVRDKNYYLRLEGYKDYLEYPINGLLDISGWDLQKVLRLAHNSNPTLYEWFNSPIVYIDDNSSEIKEVIYKYFSKRKILLHYYHIAKDHYDNYIAYKENINIKKYFYILRSLFAAKYVMKFETVPKVEFDLLRKEIATEEINNIIDGLLKIKISNSEDKLISQNKILDNYILKTFEEVKNYISDLKDLDLDWDLLNETFLNNIDKN